MKQTKTIAIVGMPVKDTRAAYFVARYMQLKGYRIIPVNPGHAGKEILGEKIYASLADIPAEQGPIDMIDIFRNSEAAGQIVDEALEVLLDKGLKTIWMQLGVENEAAAVKARKLHLEVIMNRCPKIEYSRLFGELRWGGFNTGIISSRLHL